MIFSGISLFSCITAVSATTLFVSSYGGNVTTLSLREESGKYTLTKTSSSADCAPSPSWLTIDADRGLLFCLNEGTSTTNGSVSSYTINAKDGSLNHVKNETSITAPVDGAIYGDPAGQRKLATAHYSGSALSTWTLEGGGRFHLDQLFQFNLTNGPGPVPSRQNAAHEHQVVVDPTGQYLVVPDLGADLVRVFAIDAETQQLSIKNTLKAPPGTGPRHAVFYNPYSVTCEEACEEACTSYLYVIGELSSQVIGYAVNYLPNQNGLNFTQVYNSSTLGSFQHQNINAPAEIHISPDNRFMIISNRNSAIFQVPTKNGTTLPEDPISTFSLNHDGSADLVQLWPSGGSWPRQFSINKAGNMVAVGNQNSNRVDILSRDVASGLLGDTIGSISIDGSPTCVVFNE